ncbi:PREDICTED: protein trichome birefringence-like 6 isoform X1 [Nelumbo nucifera]|uniref:Protein trichome birefringence-like 6 isoform X1 n=1 Tax=Nelumbo nucifera TaxID=4432 RepID=A0A1U8AJX7_NELNU|nr:PREDICTED: protein trichome birefringence-like 6 isoform X1 [Nelumbo nucifera]
MEKQRSFSFNLKPTRLLVFSFTLSSSLLLLFFSIWVFKCIPLIPQETQLHFNKSSQTLGLKPINIQAFSISAETHFRIPDISSGNSVVSVVEKVQIKQNKSGVSDRDNKSEETQNGALDGITYSNHDQSSKKIQVSGGGRIEKKKTSECDVSKGRWVFDESYPLYTNSSCPFIDEGFSCEANGRPDKDYIRWRWQPHDCNIPRFNAVKMLELIRGKRLVFVGDSINRNQWESMLCLLRGAITDPARVYETHGRRITKGKGNYSFKFVDYKCTVEYYVTHFLVHESKARVGQKRVQTLRIDSIDRGSSRWKGADVLVFNTAHWWSHYKTKAGVNYYQEGNQVYPHLDVSVAFRRALMTWASWVDRHINPHKTQVFFRSSAPSHFRGGQWNSGGHCKEATQPLNNISGTDYPEKNVIAEEVIKQMKTPVTLLNVTSLSEYRIDGHPSVYGRKPRKGTSSSIQDCSHWCLPGVPDTWNELLYYYLQSKEKHSST